MEQVDKFKSDAMNWIDHMESNLIKREIQILRLFTQKTGLKQTHAVLIAAFFCFSFILTGFGGKAVTNCIGFFYPTLKSFNAVKSKGTADDSYWLTYWIVFGLFQVLEAFGDLFLFWVPFYQFVKCCCLIWLFAPQTNGAQVVFKHFVAPFVQTHQGSIDSTIKAAKTFGDQMQREVVKPVSQHVAKKVSEAAFDAITSQLRKPESVVEGDSN
uniref:Receptor expression-enhancing protein n=1 Tax=Spongospora subterranea TaxID=70186 RepID=A0A0H5R4Y3_9EUKA|eukprot:CRZ08852.1 hypothetical protein [Spongospora subterranea]